MAADTQVAEVGAAPRGRAYGGLAVPALLFAAAALISGFTILRGGAPFDEGLVLQAARRVADGQVPYRDFLWPYGPAQPYLLGGWFELFDTSLLPWRVARVAFDAGVAVTVFMLVRRRAPLPLALLGWLAAACAMAQPTSANPFPPALLTALLAIGVASRTPSRSAHPPLAGLLVAATAAWRLDFGLYAGAAAIAAIAARRDVDGRGRQALVAAGTALAGGLLVHLPFLVAEGPAGMYRALVGDSLSGRDHWTLPFPLPWDGPTKDALENAVPLLLVVGLAVATVAAAVSWRRRGAIDPREAGLLVFAGGAALYLLSRPDELHTAPLLVTLGALVPLLSARLLSTAVVSAVALVAILGLLALDGVAHRAKALVSPPELATIDVPVADGAKAPPAEARALEWMVATVQRLVPPGGDVYAVTRRSDLVRFNQPLVYVLTERRNPTDRDFGLLAEPERQRRTVRALERSRPRAIVRWTDPISVEREPNLRGEPSGSRLLDEWLRANYRRHGARGHYEVLVPRG